MQILDFVAKHPFITLMIAGKAASVVKSVTNTVTSGFVNTVSIIRTGKDPRVRYTKSSEYNRENGEVTTVHEAEGPYADGEDSISKTISEVGDAVVTGLNEAAKPIVDDIINTKKIQEDGYTVGAYFSLEDAERDVNTIKDWSEVFGDVRLSDIDSLLERTASYTDPKFFGWTEEEVKDLKVVFDDGQYKIQFAVKPHAIESHQEDQE